MTKIIVADVMLWRKMLCKGIINQMLPSNAIWQHRSLSSNIDTSNGLLPDDTIITWINIADLRYDIILREIANLIRNMCSEITAIKIKKITTAWLKNQRNIGFCTCDIHRTAAHFFNYSPKWSSSKWEIVCFKTFTTSLSRIILCM